MELAQKEGLYGISTEEMCDVDGGVSLPDALDVVEFVKDCFMFGFNVGRQLAREVKEFYTVPEFIIVEGEPIP